MASPPSRSLARYPAELGEVNGTRFRRSYIDRSALVIMHYQVDVFAILFGEQPSPLLDRVQ